MEDEEDKDPDKLNVQSEKFDALHALYSKKVIVPFPSAPVLDNVAKATSLLSRNQDLVNEPSGRSVKNKKKVEPATSATGKFESDPDPSGAMPKFKSQKTVLTRMEETKGPLAFLKACMEKRIRVKVWTRTARGIRGYCLGFVVAFDKHWNLVLEDVQEVWSRRVKRKKYVLGEPNEMPLAWKAMGPVVKPPKVVVTKGSRGTETCERHVNQMLMRGECYLRIPDTPREVLSSVELEVEVILPTKFLKWPTDAHLGVRRHVFRQDCSRVQTSEASLLRQEIDPMIHSSAVDRPRPR